MYSLNLKEIEQLEKNYNFIPLFKKIKNYKYSAKEVFEKISYTSNRNKKYNHFLLESMEKDFSVSRYSFIAIKPIAVFKMYKDKAIVYENKTSTLLRGKEVFSLLAKYLKSFKVPKLKDLPPFSGGAVGFSTYEAIQGIEQSVPCQETQDPIAYYPIFDTCIVFDKLDNSIQVITHIDMRLSNDLKKSIKVAKNKIYSLLKTLNTKIQTNQYSIKTNKEKINYQNIKSDLSKKEFCDKVKKIKKYIFDGDIIQAVLSQTFEMENKLLPIEIYNYLRAYNPSPYMYCLHINKQLSIVGSSPEVHVRYRENKILMRPIAGTRKLKNSKNENKLIEAELLNDKKEAAEHLMLVDLARNDLSRICKVSSLSIEEFMVVRYYSSVMHLESEITAKLDEQNDYNNILSATFPAGTVTGAPKIRAMQIINELENNTRGVYAGIIGYISFNGSIDSCIAIRTIILKKQKAFIRTGAGIVADSDPNLEFKETYNKAFSIIKACQQANDELIN